MILHCPRCDMALDWTWFACWGCGLEIERDVEEEVS